VANVPTVAGAEATDGSLVPTLFVAVTVNVYEFRLERPLTRHEVVVVVVQVAPPGLAVTVYFVITRPPLETGAVHVTSEEVSSPEVAVTPVGCPGTAGATLVDGEEATLGPARLLATTVKV